MPNQVDLAVAICIPVAASRMISLIHGGGVMGLRS
jgi:hypothetical protein